MSEKNHHYCVILAGGKGRRLWPVSREEKPKQFLDFFGTGRTQLQQTYDRVAKLFPKDHIYVDTNQLYVDLVREQLPDLEDFQLLIEPIHRNTAPSVGWAAHRIKHVDSEASLMVAPADHAVFNEEAFAQNVQAGWELVDNNEVLLTLGVKPTRPEPGYGYVQLGDPQGNNVYKVKSFTEKPDREFAKMFVQSGEFYWNTGIFLANVRYLLHCFETLLPEVLRQLDVMHPNDYTIEIENEFMRENFPRYPNISIDMGILEKSENVYVMKCDFGWGDLGTWHSTYEALCRSANDNVVVDTDAMLENCTNNIIKLPKDRLAVISGLNGYIVAEQGNVLLICPKEDSSALIRKYITEVQLKKGEEYL